MNFRIIAAAVAAIAIGAFIAPSAMAGHSCKHRIYAIDPDGDNSMTMYENVRRALAVFAAINPDGDRTLEPDETAGRISMAAFVAADRNKDGRLSRGEWVRRAVILFKKANTDGDRTIECDELASGYGAGLYRMLR
ncbi:MAG: hypothetical protein NW205_13600 [Hyphomicrobiaceae bacterium]|nr:hypothetical protein [Hyphomicrobiaceae bacterium]